MILRALKTTPKQPHQATTRDWGLNRVKLCLTSK